MSTRPHRDNYTRRQFLGRGMPGAGLFAAIVSGARAPASEPAHAVARPEAAPQQVAAKLLNYEQVRQFKCPRPDAKRLACGPDGALYVGAGKYVSVLDDAGAVRSELALAAPVRCLAVAEDGAAYASLRDHLEVFDAQGQRQAVWDCPADRTWITGLAVGAKEVFAADAGNRCVLRYDRSGKLTGRLGQKDPARGIPGLVVPSPFFDVALGADGLLRVNNPGRHQVESYTRQGELALAWGRPASALEGFCGCCNPIHLALLPDGRVVTCEKGIPRVKVYSAAGALDSLVAGPDLFSQSARVTALDHAEHIWGGLDVAADPRGRIYILDWAANSIRLMARKANV